MTNKYSEAHKRESGYAVQLRITYKDAKNRQTKSIFYDLASVEKTRYFSSEMNQLF